MEDRPGRPDDPRGGSRRGGPSRGSSQPPSRKVPPPDIARRRGDLTPPPADRRSAPRNPILPGDRAPRRGGQHRSPRERDTERTGNTERIPRASDERRSGGGHAAGKPRPGPGQERQRTGSRGEPPGARRPSKAGAGTRRPPRAAESGPRPVRRSAPRRRTAGLIGKSLLAVISVLVLGVTGVVWGKLGGASNGLTTVNVLDSGTGAAPLDGAMDVLLVGLDSRTDSQGHPLDPKVLAALHAGKNSGELNTDTMILLHIPQNGKHATAVSLPRDSLVNRPGYGMGKLNSAFLAARNAKLEQLKKQGEPDPAKRNRLAKEAGAKELIRTVENLTGVTIEHYAAVNLVGFYNLSKAMGGVPVCLNHDVSDPYYSGAHFHKGVQVIEGKQALQFVRQRHNIPGGSTDLERERRQQAFLASMAHKVLSAGTLTDPAKLSSLVDAVKKSITIDQNWNLLKFARQMRGLTSGGITFATMPVVSIDAHSSQFGAYVKVNPAKIHSFFDNLTHPQPQSAPKPTTPAPQADNSADHSATTVDIRNAAGVTGMASRVSDVLKHQGFTAGDTGNASSRQSSVIHYAGGSQAAARQVSQALGGGLTLQRDTGLASGHVRVYLGTDYSGPGRHAGSAQSTGSSGAPNASGSAPATTTAPKPPQPPIVEDNGGPPCVN